MELKWRFIVVPLDEVILDWPKVGKLSFNAIGRLIRLTLLRFTRKFYTEIFAPYRRFPPLSGCSKLVGSSWLFFWTSQNGNVILSSFCHINTTFWKSSRDSFPNSFTKIPGNIFLSNWWIFNWSLCEIVLTFNHWGRGHFVQKHLCSKESDSTFDPNLIVVVLLKHLLNTSTLLASMSFVWVHDKSSHAVPNSIELSVCRYNFWFVWRLQESSCAFVCYIWRFIFTRISFNPFNGKILYHFSVSVIVPSLRTLWSAAIKSPTFLREVELRQCVFCEGHLFSCSIVLTSEFRSFGKWARMLCFLDYVTTYVEWMFRIWFLEVCADTSKKKCSKDFQGKLVIIAEDLSIGRPIFSLSSVFYFLSVFRGSHQFPPGTKRGPNCSWRKWSSFHLWSSVAFANWATRWSIRGLYKTCLAIGLQAIPRLPAQYWSWTNTHAFWWVCTSLWESVPM